MLGSDGDTVTSFGVTLLSGGLDSTTVTAYARERVDHLTALTFNYGQSHAKEFDCARHIADLLSVEHRLIDASFIRDVAWYSALTDPDSFPVPHDRTAKEMGSGIPITYVPLRNTMFLALSAAFLESAVLNAIEVDGLSPADIQARLYVAVNAIDYSGYPDCRPEYYDRVKETLRYGSKLGTEYGVAFQVETPVIELSKAEIAELGVRLKAPLEHTWSCYEASELPCERCDACVLRARGFSQAGIPDPLMVRLGRA